MLENVFSLIHQGLIGSIASLANQCGIADIPCPEFAQGIKAAIDQYQPNRGFIRPPQLVGVEFTSQEIRYMYNWPVANHGIAFVLIVGTKEETARLSFEISHYQDKAANGGLENATQVLKLLSYPTISFVHEPSEVLFSSLP